MVSAIQVIIASLPFDRALTGVYWRNIKMDVKNSWRSSSVLLIKTNLSHRINGPGNNVEENGANRETNFRNSRNLFKSCDFMIIRELKFTKKVRKLFQLSFES